MKRLGFLLAAAVVSAALVGCNISYSSSSTGSASNLKASTNIVQTGAIPPGVQSLEVVNAFGEVHITGDDSHPAGWSQILTVRAPTDADVQQIVSGLLCKAESDNDHLHLKLIVTVPNSSGQRSFQSDLEITVPKSVAVQSHNQYGVTEIAGLNGNVEAVSKFGAVKLRDIGGAVNAETSYALMEIHDTGRATLKNQFGAIDAANIRGPLDADTSYAPLDARDIGGPVRLRNQFGLMRVEKAGEADLSTSYGELRVKEINGDAVVVNRFGRVSVESVTGSVKAETSYGPMDITGAGTNFVCDNQFGGISVRATSVALANLEARTSYAALDVRLPAGLKPSVQARTSYGDIDSDFPVLLKGKGRGAFPEGPSAAPRVNLQNQNGNIRVRSE